jgi:hypothetical protein
MVAPRRPQVREQIKKILSWKWWWAVGVVILVSITYSTCGSCTTDWRAQYNEMKGRYEAYRAIAGADAREMAAQLIAKNAIITAQNKTISERDAEIVSKYQQISTSVKKLTQLEAEFATLGADNAAKVTNLVTQVATIKRNLTLAYSIIEDKDAQIGAWRIKFDTAEKISAEWKRAYEGEQKLRLMAEGLVTLCEKRQSRTLFASKLKNVAIVGLAGVAAYNLIKK